MANPIYQTPWQTSARSPLPQERPPRPTPACVRASGFRDQRTADPHGGGAITAPAG